MIRELVIGQKVEKLFCILKSFVFEKEDGAQVVLKDKDGKIVGFIRSDLLTNEIRNLVGSAVKISAVVRPGKDMEPELNVKSITKALQGEFNPLELSEGLSEEKIEEYKTIISLLKRQIKHPGYNQLVTCLLTDDVLNRLASLPASLAYYGRYNGGALAGAALISIMCRDSGVEYVRHFNGIQQRNINWSLLLCGSLLNTIGVLEYLTPEAPYAKTPVGVAKGYVGVTQSMIERTVYTNSIPLTEEELANVINVITCSVALRTGVKAMTKEGIILRHCVALYAELDMLDLASAEHETEDEGEQYFYASSLRRYIAS